MNRVAPVAILAESSKVRLEMETSPTSVIFRPVGTIDEDVNFSLIYESLRHLPPQSRSAEFDLGHISRINSCGVREWILLMERLSPVLHVCFSNLNELFIEQANMIPAMLGSGKNRVKSFHVPYHCGSCDTNLSMIAEPAQVEVSDGEVLPPPFLCPKCGLKLEFDWFEDGYFNFLGLV